MDRQMTRHVSARAALVRAVQCAVVAWYRPDAVDWVMIAERSGTWNGCLPRHTANVFGEMITKRPIIPKQ
jgi:hypothetical protein